MLGWNTIEHLLSYVSVLQIECELGLVLITAHSCWDGVNTDSPDHKSHVAYPVNGSFERGSPCPDSHPVKLPQLFYEVMWDTEQFNDLSLWPEDGSQPFVFSTGDA